MLRPHLRRPLLLRAALLLGLLASLFALVACSSSGSEPMRLDHQVTDEVGALDGRTAEVDAALERLRTDTGIQLFVVFVDSFGDTPAQRWAADTAARSDLGDRDALLAVATGDRSYAYNVDQDSALTDAQLDAVAATAIEPTLHDNDWAGAVIGAADGYRAVLAGQAVPKPVIVPGNPDPGSDSGGGSGTAWVLVLVVLAAAGVVWAVAMRSRHRTRQARLAVDPNDAHPGVSTQALSERANTLLLRVDDSLRTSERELGLAQAEYGPAATASFSTAVAAAKADVAEAFRLRMELDDLSPTDDIGTRQRLAEIIRRGEAAAAALDAESDAFDELRALESTLDQTIPALSQRRTELAARVPTVAAELDQLRAAFSGPALTGLSTNAEQAGQRLRFATSTLATASEQSLANRRSAAALSVRAADQALDQADELLTAVDTAATDLRAARDALPALMAEVGSELDSARAAAPSAPPPMAAELATAVAAAEAALTAVRAALAGTTMDPLAEQRRLREADAGLDQALAHQRDAAERATKAAAMLPTALAAAQAEVDAATAYLNTRRGAVGTQARTLLAEAIRVLAAAQVHATADPVTALAEAQRADQLAEQASAAAQSDVDSWRSPGGFAGPGGYGGQGYRPGGFAGPRRGTADGLAGAILGGILIGGSRGGWGGTWGGGRSPGGFGGGRRSGGGGFGGGGFGGGGRRGGGGRF